VKAIERASGIEGTVTSWGYVLESIALAVRVEVSRCFLRRDT
jgi:hypothetical protein